MRSNILLVLKSVLCGMVLLVGGNGSVAQENVSADSLEALLEESLRMAGDEKLQAQVRQKGEKAYRLFQRYAGKGDYVKALDVFEKSKSDIMVWLGKSDAYVKFHESVIELYYKVFDEEEARRKAIVLRELNDVCMDGVMAFGDNKQSFV